MAFRHRFLRKFSSVVQGKNPNFKSVSEHDIAFFRKTLGENNVLSEPNEISGYNSDWMGKYSGDGKIVLRPKTSEEISNCLQYCHENDLPITPQGGNTGLVGGSVPVFDEIILSTTRMNQIYGLDHASSILTCDAGCILEKLDNWLGEEGFMMPLDLGAKGTCQIGGNVSTNAGGLRFMRYGSLKGNVLGLEVVLADGKILNLMSANRKDTTGYDLKQLFIGAEGSLGIVTKIAISVPRKPQAVNVMFLGIENWENVLLCQKLAKEQLGEIISAIEYLDDPCMQVTLSHQKLQHPLSEVNYPFYLLIETHGGENEHDQAKIMTFLENCFENEFATDGCMAENETHMSNIWSIRERISECLKAIGHVYKYDISLPVSEKQAVIEKMKNRLGNQAQVFGFGHLADGNLHLNIVSPKKSEEVFNLIEPFVYECVQELKGSISAEHGMGLMKPNAMKYTKPPLAIDYMKQIKALFDPKGILNPYKVLPSN